MFFRKNRELQKSVTLYISKAHNKIIVCPRCVNNAGIIYEHEPCTLLNFPPDHSVLGEEVLRNFHLFGLKDKNLRDQKKSDWPAFKSSGLKTIKSFEDSFVPIFISGNNESNIMLSIEAPLAGHEDTFITSSISSAYPNKEKIGERIVRVYNTATALPLVKPI